MCDYGWDEVDANVVCQQMRFTYQRALPTNNSHFGAGEGPILLEYVGCNQSHSNLSQCIDYFKHIGTVRRCIHTAGVICEDMMMSTSTKQVPTIIIYVTTANVSHESTYKSHDITPTASVIAIVVTVGALILLATAITVIALVLIARLRLTTNR